MRKLITLFCVFCGSFLSANEMENSENKLIILKKGEILYARSFFSPKQDVVISLGKGRNGQFNFERTMLIPVSALFNFEKVPSTSVIHRCGDDSTPWNLNHTYIGANHGFYGVKELTVKNHGLTEADIGNVWLDEKKKKFYLIKILDPDRLWILTDNIGTNDIWSFNTTISGKFLSPMSGDKKLDFSKSRKMQLIPACRITKQRLLVDGKTPLEDNKPVVCKYLDAIEEYDIISPNSLLMKIKNNPGEETDFTGDDLKSVVTNRICYRFQPRGTCLVIHHSKANQQFKLGYMGFIQSAALAKRKIYDTHEYYIPKTLPFRKKNLDYDFINIQDYSGKIPVPLHFNEKEQNIVSQSSLPDRFIQFLGIKENGKIKRKVGYAIGYSLIEGITRPEIRAKNCNNSLFLYTSKKTYPAAIDSKMGVIPAGTEFYCMAYRQYYDPNIISPNATSIYWNKQGNSYVLYADYHKSVSKDIIKTPKEWIGKKISIIEQTPGIKLVSGKTITVEGIALSIENNYGSIVLNINVNP